MSCVRSTRLLHIISRVAFGLLFATNCLADTSPEQLIAILDNQKLPDEIRCFAAKRIQFGNSNIKPEHQQQINQIATSIFQNDHDGQDLLKPIT
jgi:hypothetical protein